ncbi:MAG: PKD domain-containing protein, partial [Lachnospiraceae bacterium]|nr:PKD domain-containing protein [Lachnospiraceae bacterium]
DREVEPGVTYYYQVIATDLAGNESEPSAVIEGTALPDEKAPEILSVYPAIESIIGPSMATVRVLARDNRALDSIVIEYSLDGETYQTLLEKTQIGEYNDLTSAALPLENVEHGATVWVKIYVSDITGNVCESEVFTYTVDRDAPTVESTSLSYEDGAITLLWIGGMEPDLAGYRVYRKTVDGEYALVQQIEVVAEQSEYSYWDDTLSKEAETYVYKIEAVDKCSNATVFETESISIPSRTMPKAVISADRVMIVGAEYAIDGGMSYDDNAIVSYTWDLGDGNTSTDKCVIHAYAATGIYVVTLTVTDDEGKTHTTTQEIEVINDDLAGSVVVQIVDEEGKPIPGAPVYFNLGTEEQVIKETGSSGMASFVAKAGKYAVGCVIPNNQWLPTKKDIIVTAGSNTNITMTLVNKPIVEGRFEIERMTLDEIIAAGIDPTDPVNQNYVQINLHLQYDNMDIDVSIPSGGGGGGGGITPIIIPGGGDGEDDEDGAVGDYDGGSRILFPIPIREYNPSEEIAVALLDIPLGVATLKEFFDVRLHIINNSGSEFSMLDNVITLNIPEGLSLMETYDTSGAIVRIAEIMGQTTETIEWILRGDEVGEYYISADYSGILSQFLTPIRTKFEASEPIEVFGMTNLRVILDVANALDKGTLYYNVSLINEGEIDVYRPSITGPDTLFEMELFDAKNVITAEAYDFNAMQITQLNLSQKLSALPDILGAGERLTLHYMNVNQTQYSECTFALESAMLEYQNTYGLEVELVRRPVEYFKQNLSTSINALEKAEAILKDAEHMSAYEYLITDPNYAYWCMTNDLDGLGMTNTSNEIGFELISGDWADALGKDDHEQAKKMIYAALGLTADENAFAEYSELLNFVTELYSVFKTVNTYTDFTYMTKAERNSLELAMKSMSEDYKWELYWGLYGGNKHRYGAFSDYFTFTWQVTHLNKYEVELKDGESKIIQFFKEDFISEVFTGIGMGLEQAEKIVGIMKDTAADISVYVKAQGDINTYNFYVDMLQGYMPYDSMFSDGWLMYEMLDDVRAVINSEDVMGKFIENTKEAAFWEAMDRGGSNLMSTIGIPSLILTAAGLGADFMDTLFNINEQQDVANNIRFITCMSDSINDALSRKKNDSTDTEQAAQEFMMLVKLMLDLRAIGESQVAQYGVAAEKGILPVGSRQLFVAVADYTGAPGDVTSWYLWRDYVEDKISRCRIALLKNPTGTEVTSSQKPIVTFNYATGQTAQTFDSSYKYSLDGGKTWTVCDGNAISVARP